MGRPAAPPPALHLIRPPPDLTAEQLALWHREFDDVPLGHFVRSDVPSMRDHVLLVEELGHAKQHMLARDRQRDAAQHWRSLVAAVLNSRRALRLVASARQGPKRAGRVAAGGANADPCAYDPSNHDWRSLFRNQGGIKLVKRPHRRGGATATSPKPSP